MDQKYAVPALDRANAVLMLLAEEPYRWKLSDLSKRLDISKSTMHSLLTTLERLQWIKRDRAETFAVGSVMGDFGSAYFRQYDLIEEFRRNAGPVMARLQESVQLARMDGSDVQYLAKVEAPTPVQMVSGTGVRSPAHATGLGKAMLAFMEPELVKARFPDDELPRITPHTITAREAFTQELDKVRLNGYALDEQEGVMGFCCVAAPVFASRLNAVAAVSCSIPVHQWESKKETALHEITALASRLSTTL